MGNALALSLPIRDGIGAIFSDIFLSQVGKVIRKVIIVEGRFSRSSSHGRKENSFKKGNLNCVQIVEKKRLCALFTVAISVTSLQVHYGEASLSRRSFAVASTCYRHGEAYYHLCTACRESEAVININSDTPSCSGGAISVHFLRPVYVAKSASFGSVMPCLSCLNRAIRLRFATTIVVNFRCHDNIMMCIM